MNTKIIKTKIKAVGIYFFVAGLIAGLYFLLRDGLDSFFQKDPEAADKTPPVTATSAKADTSSTGKFLGDQVITLLATQDYVLTVPAGAVSAQFQVQDNPVLLRLGSSPVSGGFLCDVDELHYLETAEEVKKAVFRTKTGTATMIINYFSA